MKLRRIEEIIKKTRLYRIEQNLEKNKIKQNSAKYYKENEIIQNRTINQIENNKKQNSETIEWEVVVV